MEDVPLRKAIVVARGIAPKLYPPSCRIVQVLQYPITPLEALTFEYTCGADDVRFRAATPKIRIRILFQIKSVLMEHYDVPEQIVHDALMVIPAYRRAMKGAGHG